MVILKIGLNIFVKIQGMENAHIVKIIQKNVFVKEHLIYSNIADCLRPFKRILAPQCKDTFKRFFYVQIQLFKENRGLIWMVCNGIQDIQVTTPERRNIFLY